MPTQAARVAVWVPTTVPGAIGQGVQATNTPAGAQAPIATQFGTPAVAFSDGTENAAGTNTGKALNPAGLRTELVRLLGIPTGTMQSGDIVAQDIAEVGMLVKTDASGKVSTNLLPPGIAELPAIIDAGTF